MRIHRGSLAPLAPLAPLASLALVVALAGCDRPAPPSISGTPSEASKAPPAAAPSPSAPPSTAVATSASASTLGGVVGLEGPFAAVAGTSCAGHGVQVTKAADASAFTRKGDAWSRNETWGCGCPTGLVFTMVYTPKTNPLEVRLCTDPNADHCEALCRREVGWDLSAALKDAGASDVKFVN